MAEHYQRAFKIGALTLTQGPAWRAEAATFSDLVTLGIETRVEGHVQTTGTTLSLDALVEFVTSAREEWRSGRERALATGRRVTS